MPCVPKSRRGVLPSFHLKNWHKSSRFWQKTHQRSMDTLYGTDPASPIISQKHILSPCASANAKGFCIPPASPLYAPRYSPAKGQAMSRSVKTLKKLNGFGADGEAVVVYQDEVHFQVTVSVTRKWGPKGFCPQVKSAPGRETIAYSGYVVPFTGELLVTKPSWFNYETVIESFRDFIKSYPVQEGKRLYLVLDNAHGIRKRSGLYKQKQRKNTRISVTR